MKYALLVYGEKAHADTSDAERTTFQREYLALNDAPDVHVRATTTQPVMKDTDLTGADDYMHGLKEFAQGVLPASLDVNASLGDERNAPDHGHRPGGSRSGRGESGPPGGPALPAR